MKVTRSGEIPSLEANSDWYTGTVWTTQLAEGDPPHRLNVVSATFLPGARTAWHTHPFGQILLGTSGVGWVQLAGHPAQKLHPGDTAVIAANERHWHGAGPNQVFTHISMQGATADGKMADWSDQVTDEDYLNATNP